MSTLQMVQLLPLRTMAPGQRPGDLELQAERDAAVAPGVDAGARDVLARLSSMMMSV